MNIPDKALEAAEDVVGMAQEEAHPTKLGPGLLARIAVAEAAPRIAAQALRDHAANLRFIAARSRQDEATGLDQAADIAKATADELDPL